MAERGGAVRGAGAGSTVTSAGGLTAAHDPSSSARPTTDSESFRAAPAKLRGVRWRGDTLLIVNRDRTSHRIGELWVAPGSAASATVTAGLLAAQSLVCSFHPGGAIGVSPQSLPGLEATALPTTLLGVPLTLAVVVTLSIVRRLRVEDDPLPAPDVPLAETRGA